MYYAIGDIHGKAAMLRALLAALDEAPLRPDDELVFLGDYVDRGEESPAVLDILIDLKARRPNTVFLRGNHEQMMLDARDGQPPTAAARPGFIRYSIEMVTWLDNGGVDTLTAYGVEDFLRWPDAIPEAHWRFLEATRLEYRASRYWFVHAGLLPLGETWEGEEFGAEPRLWIREPFLSSDDPFDGRTVVFGHTPQRDGRPLVLGNKLGIDTYAIGGGALTAAELDPTGTSPAAFIQVVEEGA